MPRLWHYGQCVLFQRQNAAKGAERKKNSQHKYLTNFWQLKWHCPAHRSPLFLDPLFVDVAVVVVVAFVIEVAVVVVVLVVASVAHFHFTFFLHNVPPITAQICHRTGIFCPLLAFYRQTQTHTQTQHNTHWIETRSAHAGPWRASRSVCPKLTWRPDSTQDSPQLMPV